MEYCSGTTLRSRRWDERISVWAVIAAVLWEIKRIDGLNWYKAALYRELWKSIWQADIEKKNAEKIKKEEEGGL